MKKELFSAIWTFVGVTVGAGVFALPYVFSKAGFLTALIVFIFTAIFMTIITLYLGEVVLRTRGKHQLTGLAEKYLGTKGKTIMFIANSLSIFGILAAYIIAGGQALGAIFGFNSFWFQFVFFALIAPVIYFGIKIIDGFEWIFTPIKIIVVVTLSLLLVKLLDFSNFSSLNVYNLFIPYGVAIFAFAGISAVPEMNEELTNKKLLRQSIIYGMIITFVINILFAVFVMGSIKNVNEVATVSLMNVSFSIGMFANLFALFSIATAFVALGFALKENLTLDYKVNNLLSGSVVIFVPFLIVLSGFLGFIQLLDIVGAVCLGIILIMIMIMHSKAKFLCNRIPEYDLKDNKFLKVFLVVVLLIGIIYTLKLFY
ncbi:hypothetical protein J4216_01285 [Candidatus Woesearchaeota archaeon]|nr:hypothetical protein [Candidatus Woesearchaeota archaeon]